ncbi:MAG TPA: hypothetical protein VFH68_14820 [Polyangia bacterium]|jgi:hypothetical protein|nr:hypothetical protein [Polyangia bacterium]
MRLPAPIQSSIILLARAAALTAAFAASAAAQPTPLVSESPAVPAPPVVTSAPAAMAPPPPIAPEPAQVIAPIEIHGFMSQGLILTTGNDYLAPDTKHGSFQFSEVAINFTTEVSDQLRLGVQAFAQNLGLGENFNLKADWFYVDYRWKDWLGLRAGRLKIPFGLYNEVNDIDAARAPILLPQSTYPLQGRNFLFAETGVELYGFLRARSAGALEYRAYVGTIFIDRTILVPPGSSVDLQLNVRRVIGGRLFWETPVHGLRLGVSALAVRLYVTAFSGGVAYPIQNRAMLEMASLEYVRGGLAVTAEYSRWPTVQESSIPGSNFSITNERTYAMVSYRVAPWFQPSAYYALFFPDVNKRDGGDLFRQDDVALALRFDLTAHWIVKLEGNYMVGTAGLVPPLSVTALPTDLKTHWGVFLLKTTGYF